MRKNARLYVVVALLTISVLVIAGAVSYGEEAARHPIYISFSMHSHNWAAAPNQTKEEEWARGSEHYDAMRKEILWLKDEAAKYGAKLSWQVSGEHAEWAVFKGDRKDAQDYLDAGHSIGVHWHSEYREGDRQWRRQAGGPGSPLGPEATRKSWEDNYSWVKKFAPDGYVPIRLDPQDPWWEDPYYDQLMKEFGIKIGAAPENHITGFMDHLRFGHHVWNPYRKKTGTLLGEDPSTPFIEFPTYAQIGRDAGSGVHGGLVLKVPQVKRHIIMCYLEWLHAGRAGLPDKIWTAGWVTHPDQNAQYHEEVSEMWRWAKEMFIGKKTPKGDTIGVFATDTDVLHEFEKWEKENPGRSSFNWKDGDPYPYYYTDMPKILDNSGFDKEINTWSSQGIHCYRIIGNDYPEPEKGTPIFILWKDSGEAKIDFSEQMKGKVSAKDGRGGEKEIESNALAVGEEPVFVTPVDYVAKPVPMKAEGMGMEGFRQKAKGQMKAEGMEKGLGPKAGGPAKAKQSGV